MSIETEMAMGQLKERHSQEVQDLKIELETKVEMRRCDTLAHAFLYCFDYRLLFFFVVKLRGPIVGNLSETL